MTVFLLRHLILAAMLLGLAACGTDPTIATVNISASTGLNPNRDEQPSPTVVRIYDLRSVDTFNQLTFFELFDKDTQRLGADLLNRREVEVKPGQALTFTRTADPAALYLGVIAGYRSVADIQWRASVALTPETTNRIVIRLDPLSLTMNKPRRRFLGIF